MVDRRRYLDEYKSLNSYDFFKPRKVVNRNKVAAIFLTITLSALVCGCLLLAVNSNSELRNLHMKLDRAQQQAVKTETRFRRSLENTRSLVERKSQNVRHLEKRQAPNAEENEEVDPRRGEPLITSGYAAGAHHTHTGGVSDCMCLHKDVTYTPGKFIAGHQSSSYIYGLEFRDALWVYPLFDLSLIEIEALQFHSVPCATCLAHGNAELMIPGREECPKGWVKQYVGYIMSAGHSDKHPTSPICVDEQPQVVPGTEGNQQGASLFMVETNCVSLLCEPFVAGREIRCVVCTL